MLKTPLLTDRHVADFDRDGCVVVPAGFDGSDMERIEGWANELAALPETPGRHWVFHEESLKDGETDLINRIECISPFHDGFKVLSGNLKAPVAQLFGEAVVLFKEKINFKMAGGGGFEPHQDFQAGWHAYARNFINVMVCIDPATAENGCLEVAPGHHRRGLLRGMEPLTEGDMEGMEFRLTPTQPGDLVFFNSHVPHRSRPNMTGNMRRLYFATYNRAAEGDHLTEYYADKHKTYPPDIDRDPDKEYIYKV